VERAQNSISVQYKEARAEELRLQLADEIVRGAPPPGSALDETRLRRAGRKIVKTHVF
jgi:hypothetical protein